MLQKGWKIVLISGLGTGLVLLLLKLMYFRFVLVDRTADLYALGTGVLFFGVGYLLKSRMSRHRLSQEDDTPAVAASGHGLSTRELEVLRLIAGGHSNQEIADRLCVSLNTVKTHSSRIFEKLDVRRRTQAAEKARRMNLV